MSSFQNQHIPVLLLPLIPSTALILQLHLRHDFPYVAMVAVLEKELVLAGFFLQTKFFSIIFCKMLGLFLMNSYYKGNMKDFYIVIDTKTEQLCFITFEP